MNKGGKYNVYHKNMSLREWVGVEGEIWVFCKIVEGKCIDFEIKMYRKCEAICEDLSKLCVSTGCKSL
jgi:hypothetical protein